MKSKNYTKSLDLLKKLEICIDINSHAFESSACRARLLKTTAEGFAIAYDLIKLCVKERDEVGFAAAYTQSGQLLPAPSVCDPAVYRKLKDTQNAFKRRVVALVSEHSSFLLKHLIPAVNEYYQYYQQKGK